jgi:uncharacterized protein
VIKGHRRDGQGYGVEFFCYHRDRPGSVTLGDKLLEQHWSYMDRYEAEMIARGPTLAGYQAGVYRDVLLRRWRNLLGRTMRDFPGGRTGGNRYLVLGLGTRQSLRLRG